MPPLDFTNALAETQARFKAHPHWRMLDGTPWANDAPVITAELMRLAYVRGLADAAVAAENADLTGISTKIGALWAAAASIRALAPVGHETDDDLPRGVAGAVGPDTAGPTEAMQRKSDDGCR